MTDTAIDRLIVRLELLSGTTSDSARQKEQGYENTDVLRAESRAYSHAAEIARTERDK